MNAMYGKLNPILEDLENKNIDVAGGSVVGMVLSITNSLVNYICNLTVGKKNYIGVQDEILEIKKSAEELRNETLNIINKDTQIVGKIVQAYKIRKDEPEEFENINKEAVEFCSKVSEKALDTLKLVERVSKVGNKMLASDFKICKIYAFASVETSIINIEVNLESIKDEEYKQKKKKIYGKFYEEAKEILERM